MAVRAEVWRHEAAQEEAQQLARKASGNHKRGKLLDEDGEETAAVAAQQCMCVPGIAVWSAQLCRVSDPVC
jgi:hypothetical protein